MVKNLLTVIVFFSCCTLLSAQELVTTEKMNRVAVLEEYTGVRCGYCPEGHEITRKIKADNPVGSVVIINIHEGTFANPASGYPDYTTPFGTALRELATNSPGYPMATVNRHKFDPNVTNTTLSRNAWTDAARDIFKMASPVNVGLESNFNKTTRELTVNVEAYYTEDVKETKNFVHVVLKESKIIGIQLDYTNGTQNNYSHDNMLRHMITGQWGDTINSPKTGTLVKKQYTYTVPDNFVIENCEIAAFITQSKQEIYSGAEVKADGGKTIVLGTMKTNDKLIVSGTMEQKSDFSFMVKNTMKEKSTIKISLTSTQPNDWKAELSMEGKTSGDNIMIDLEPNQEIPLHASVIPGSSAAVGNYVIKISSEKYPEAFELRKEINLIANADELLISHTDAVKFESNYKTSLTNAGSAKCASARAEIFADLFSNNALTGIKNIFYNISWSFPAMSDDNALALQNALDEGVNLFIAGQDIAWDIGSNDTRAHGTTITKSFLRNYLSVLFISDGDSTINEMSMFADDPIFGQLGKSNIVDAHNKNLYPEVVSPLNGAYPILQYEGAHEGKIGGIRHDFKMGKVVYLGIGIEQIEDKTLADNIIKTSRDWFAGVLSADDELNTEDIRVSPLPAQNTVNITVPNNSTVELFDLFGTKIYSEKTVSGILQFDVNNLPSGTYTVQIRTGNIAKRVSKQIQIVH